MAWTKKLLLKIVQPSYLIKEIAEAAGVDPRTVGRWAYKLGIITDKNKKHRRLTPEEAVKVLNSINPFPGNPNWSLKK